MPTLELEEVDGKVHLSVDELIEYQKKLSELEENKAMSEKKKVPSSRGGQKKFVEFHRSKSSRSAYGTTREYVCLEEVGNGEFYVRVTGGSKEYGIPLGSLEDPDSRISTVLDAVPSDEWYSKSDISRKLKKDGNGTLARSDRMKACMDVLTQKRLVKAKEPKENGKGVPLKLYQRNENPREKEPDNREASSAGV